MNEQIYDYFMKNGTFLMLKLYRVLWVLFLPIIYLFIFVRLLIGKEDRNRVKEKFAIPSVKRPRDKKIVWIHAISVGESLLAMEFIKRFKKEVSDDFVFLLTTGTVSSANLVCLKNMANVIHQFAPLDYKPYIDKFLSYWQPDSVFFIESEIWPNMIFSIRCPLFLLNARLTEKSFKKWNVFYSFFCGILKRFTIIFAQSKGDFNRFSVFSKDNVMCTGNIKCSSEKLPVNKELFSMLKTDRPCLVAASTHSGEDEIILEAFKEIKAEIGEAVLFLIPRHPDRATDICKLIKSKSRFSYILRSSIKTKLSSEVVCVDSFGELGTFFELADFAFLGGSLVDIGGHNICEPIMLKCPVMFGPYMYNFGEVKRYFIEFKVAYEVRSANDISRLFCKIIRDRIFFEEIQSKFSELNLLDPIKIVFDELNKRI